MKILLVSDDKNTFQVTQDIAKGWFELIWNDYDVLKQTKLPISDAIIIEINRNEEEGISQKIIKIKCKTSKYIPILVILRGTIQEIFTALNAGAYDYIISIHNATEYRKKINNIILLSWYQKKYGVKKNRSFLFDK